MAVTVTNKQTVATLKAAKERLWDGLNRPIPCDKERYICFAVEVADPTDVGMKVVAIIESRLALVDLWRDGCIQEVSLKKMLPLKGCRNTVTLG